MRTREDTIAFEMNYCQHYNADRGNISCKVGHDIEALGGFGVAPCIRGHSRHEDPTQACPGWLRRTREMGEARADAFEKAMNDRLVLAPILAEWRKKEPIGKSEIIECPVCDGRLHLAQAACNGHVHGRCETDGCFHWME